METRNVLYFTAQPVTRNPQQKTNAWDELIGTGCRKPETRPMSASELIKPYFIENRRRILIGLVCLITVDILQLFIPRIIKQAVDDLTGFQIEGRQLLVYALYMVAIAVCIGIFRYIWRRCLLGTSRRVEEGLRNRLFAHLQSLSAAYFDKVKTGDLMAHATNDIQQIRMATGMGMVAWAIKSPVLTPSK